MKKITFLASALLMSSVASAQLFSDNFDSYAVGSYLGPQSTDWSTWSGNEGGAEDVQISDVQASSGANSIYFSSTSANGGPQDVVLDFGQQYTDGVFTFESKMFIQTGKNAYFNFQATPTIGQTWAMNFNADANGFTIDDGATADLATGSCPMNAWFTLRIEANLSLGTWEVFIDGASAGTWANSINTLASTDIFPLNGGGFFMDDVSFDHQPYTLPNLNAAVSNVSMNGNIATQSVNPTVTILNAGQTALNSFYVTINYNGMDYTEVVSGANLASLMSQDVNFNGVALVAGTNVATVTVSNVNGGADDQANDDVMTLTVNPVVPAPNKVVVGEEGTGTWCGWCPRGTVFMDRYEHQFGEFWAGIAVHNGDPMTVATYDAGIGASISGYPSALVDRGAEVDPSSMSSDFFTRLQVAPTAILSNNIQWNAGTRELTVDISADFQSAANNNYKLALVVTEDNVKGTGSGYNQANYYSSSSQNLDLIGDDGVNWKNLSNPVPAANMVYDHVARLIEPSFGGDATSFPATVNAGETLIQGEPPGLHKPKARKAGGWIDRRGGAAPSNKEKERNKKKWL